MRLYRGIHAGLFSGVGVLLVSAGAFAQEPDDAAAEDAAPEAPPAAPAPAPEPVAEEPVEAAPVAPAAPAVEEEEAPGGLSFLLFGDAYASAQTAQLGSPSPAHRAYDSNSAALTATNGFGLSFVGLDVGYDTKHFGVTTSLRFGPGVPIFYAQDPVLGGLGAITQGYVTWKPSEKLSLDFGMFGTIYGAEVAESWQNLNYTRGALYYLMQPFWHTGLRANLELTDELSLKALLVNDANQISLGQNAQAGIQLAYNTGDFGAAIGTLQTLGEGSTLGFDRFVDLVLTYMPGNFSLIFNGDLNVVDNGGGTFYGLSLAAGYQFVPAFGVAARGEFLDPDADASGNEIYTGTLTLNVLPVPEVENVVLRWDNRVEGSGAPIFRDFDNNTTDLWFSSTIGLVVHTDGLF